MTRSCPSPRRGQRGAALMKTVRRLLLLTALVGADFYVTQAQLQGGWQLKMDDTAEQHIQTLIDHAAGAANDKGAAFPGLRASLRKGMSRAGSSMLRGAANQVQIKVTGDQFEMGSAGGEAFGNALLSIAREDGKAVVCGRGRFVAAFPLMRVTCVEEGEDSQQWLLMTGWPSEQMTLFPLGLTDGRLRERAAAIQSKGEGKPVQTPDPELVKALKEVLTLHFRKIPPTT